MKSQTSKKDELELVFSNATAKEAGTVPGESIRIDPSIEKSVLRKLDFNNLGNAKTDGIDQDLKLVGNQYSIILAVFNVTFSLFDLPSNLLLKKFSGAFSGLIAFGVFQIKENLPGWKYLFLIEGGATIIIATFAAWWLPLSGSKCHWFNEAESQVAQMRLLQDGSVRTTDRLSITEALGALLDWRVLVWAVSCFCFGVAQSSVSNFLPQMVALQGYSAVKTNLYTVAPYCVGTVVLWIIAKSSDHFRERSFHLAAALIITFIGYVILATVDPNTNKGVAYFACFLLAAGAFVPSSIFHSWHTNNVTHESQRAATVGFLVGSANCAGIPSSLSFKAETAPRYMPALIVNCVFLLVGACVVIGLGTWFRLDNRRRDKEQGVRLTAGDVATQNLVGGWKDPNWRWTP
ncbi:unnamed protein product [Aspergillus oryzae]|uniref:Unnamed protein product n=2 Tax=Aspergillus oryzae TaxID=5062 RepID=A0AAN5BTZ6_ASPOZ|nr:unnamed protein product [Aspergillus oryzae]GMF93683.1 unnamed protein product [Aspergillus oryzae]GMG24775.1 unnamed protein product [Aspergillus oryzae]GMG50407.1 unnamed protein product [Aspergillus oryzae var. brunneus]